MTTVTPVTPVTAPSTMRALVFDHAAPDTRATRVATLPAPRPGPGAVAIGVRFAGVNFKDVMARRGDPGYAPGWPFVPGLEVVGTVLAVGAGVTSTAVGRQVVALTNAGGLAEVAVADAALTVPVPAGLDLRTAAAAPGAPTTAALLLDAVGRVRAGDAVLVHSAAGAVGRALAQTARRRGVRRLVGAVGSPARVAAARRAGYDEVVLRTDGLVAAVRAVEPGGVDLVLDPQGTTLLAEDLEVLAPAGRVVVFGNAGGTAAAPLPPLGRLFAGNAAVGAFSLEALSRTAPHVVAAALAGVLDDLAARRLDLAVTEVAGLDRVAAAQQALADGTGTGKYVVDVRAFPS